MNMGSVRKTRLHPLSVLLITFSPRLRSCFFSRRSPFNLENTASENIQGNKSVLTNLRGVLMRHHPSPPSRKPWGEPTTTANELSARFQLGPSPAMMLFGSSLRCRKCQGLVMIQLQDLGTLPEIPCVNCGWRPQDHDRITTESEASRSIRQATRELLQDDVFNCR